MLNAKKKFGIGLTLAGMALLLLAFLSIPFAWEMRIRWLLLGGIDFDFICESLLPSQCAQGGAPLQVGEMAYDAILVPGCETLRATTLERLEAFQAAG